jgi:type VI secretion system protein ImpH
MQNHQMPADASRPLSQVLFEDPQEFDFYQAVRLLELSLGGTGEARADEHTEPVRFRASLDLGFAPSAVRSLTAGQPPEMTVNFLSLGGPQGPLPGSLIEDILDRIRAGDESFARFLDLFHHRLLSLAYRIRKKHRVGLASGWPEQTPMAGYLFALCGLGLDELRERLPIPDRSCLRYAGLFWTRPRSATSLATLLADYFRTPVAITQFLGAWRDLSPSQWTLLGGAGARNCVLGANAICGDRAWDQQAGVAIEMGVMPRPLFQSLLPGGNAHRALQVLTRLYLGNHLEIHVRLRLAETAATTSPLGSGGRLGYESWLRGGDARPGATDSQVTFSLAAA